MAIERQYAGDGVLWWIMPWLLWAVAVGGVATAVYRGDFVYQVFLFGHPHVIAVFESVTWISLLGMVVFGVTKLFLTWDSLKKKFWTVFGMLPALIMLSMIVPPPTASFPSSVCDDKGSCYHLAYAAVPTDTVYEIWTSGDAWLDTVHLSDALSRHVSYSEDHSYTENPKLVLSGDAGFLAVKRGGQFIDLIDLASANADTGLGGECCWQNSKDEVEANSKRISALLELHSRQAESLNNNG
jgi:hypothetical protein